MWSFMGLVAFEPQRGDRRCLPYHVSNYVGKELLNLWGSCGIVCKKGVELLKTVIIGMERGAFASGLKREMKAFCRVLTAEDGKTLQGLMDGEDVDVLILDLHLPGLDPIGFLRGRDNRARVLAVADFVSPYLTEALPWLGISYLMVRPCQWKTVAQRARELLQPTVGAEARLRALLGRFSVPMGFLGSQCLLRAIPLLEEDPGQCLTVSLYPAVGKALGMDWHLVERNIRYAVAKGWEEGNRELWLRHFPRGKPRNGEFLARMAELDREIAPEPVKIGIESGICG